MDVSFSIEGERRAWLRHALICLGFLGVVVLTQWRYRDVPFYWDAIGYVLPHAMEIHRRGMSPILISYDVGHPTLFFWQLAAMRHALNHWLLAGHVLTWLYGGLMLAAMFGMLRTLAVPRLVALLATVAFLKFPLVWASNMQVLVDMPLAATTLAAAMCWARGRWGLYLVAGCAACLLKLYGFVGIGALAAAQAFLALASPDERTRPWTTRVGGVVLTALPATAFAAFMLARGLLRGWESTVGVNPPTSIVWVFGLTYWSEAFPRAFDELVVASNSVHIVLGLMALTVACTVRWLVGGCPPRIDDAPDRAAFWRGMLAMVAIAGAYGAMLFQLSGLVTRYFLPTIMCLWALGGCLVCVLVVRHRWAICGMYVVLAVVYHFQAKPSRLKELPWPVSKLLRPGLVRAPHRFENDMRFLDVIRAFRHGARRAMEDADLRGVPAGIISSWPVHLAINDPMWGYLEGRVPTTLYTTTLEGADLAAFPYVLKVHPITHLAEPLDSIPQTVTEISVRQIGEVRVELYHLE